MARTYDATAWIHPSDRHLLADPMVGISRESAAMLLGGKYEFTEPDEVGCALDRLVAQLDERRDRIHVSRIADVADRYLEVLRP